MAKATFTRIDESTEEDWAIIEAYEQIAEEALADRVLGLLMRLGENPGEQPFNVTRLEHSLQTATRAFRDGADEELVVAALLHDIGDEYAPFNHGDFAATLIKPFVSARTHWIVQQHDVFQGKYFWDKIGLDPDSREKHRGNPWFDDCEAFCRDWDCPSFDPEYPSLPLEHFEPMVRRLFARAPYSVSGSAATNGDPQPLAHG
jgi:predicted HD phosphohydrolase